MRQAEPAETAKRGEKINEKVFSQETMTIHVLIRSKLLEKGSPPPPFEVLPNLLRLLLTAVSQSSAEADSPSKIFPMRIIQF